MRNVHAAICVALLAAACSVQTELLQDATNTALPVEIVDAFGRPLSNEATSEDYATSGGTFDADYASDYSASRAAYDEVLAAEHEAVPVLVNKTTRKYQRQFYHFSSSSGDLTVFNQVFQLTTNVTQLADDVPGFRSAVCIDNANSSLSGLLITLSAGSDLRKFRPGALLLNTTFDSCDGKN
jgi:hypothetical protein